MREFAWEIGLLVGKFNHMNVYAESCLKQSTTKGTDSHEYVMGLAIYFGAHEAANDLRKYVEQAASELPALSELSEICGQFPTPSTEELRKAFYRQGRDVDELVVKTCVQEVADWVGSAMEAVQSAFESEPESITALFEFAVLSAHADSPLTVDADATRRIAEKCELPDAVWLPYFDDLVGPAQEASSAALKNLVREVRRHFRHGAGGEAGITPKAE